MERVNGLATSANSIAIIIADRPGGGIRDERKFLADCLDMLRNGTRYVAPARIAINPISTDSHLIRALQAADYGLLHYSTHRGTDNAGTKPYPARRGPCGPTIKDILWKE
jgi:hypothetical protein